MSVKDILVGQKLLSILATEIDRLVEIQKQGELNGGRIQNLEKLTKMFHILKCEDREAEKSLGNLSEEDLLKLADDFDESESTTK